MRAVDLLRCPCVLYLSGRTTLFAGSDVKDGHANLARIQAEGLCHQTCIKEAAFAARRGDKEFACPDQRRAVSLGLPNKTVMSPYQESKTLQEWRSKQAGPLQQTSAESSVSLSKPDIPRAYIPDTALCRKYACCMHCDGNWQQGL
jgi:hypothetical protein